MRIYLAGQPRDNYAVNTQPMLSHIDVSRLARMGRRAKNPRRNGIASTHDRFLKHHDNLREA